MSNSSTLGKAITENIRFVSRLGAECDHLLKLIREELSQRLLTPELARRYRADGGWIDAYINDELGWVTTEIASSLPMVIKPKRSIGGYLVVQISLTGPGIDAEGNQEPLLHIGWWANAIDFDAVQMGFPLESDTYDALALDAERLFRWTHTAFENEWCYSVRLIDINSPMDVQVNIINPVQALLLDDDASAALAGTAAVRYGKVEGREGHYRVA